MSALSSRRDILRLGGLIAGAGLLAGCDLLSTDPAGKGGSAARNYQGKEAPALADLVKEGKLPPLAQRLPQTPLQVKPFDENGIYGGTLRRAQKDPAASTTYATICRASLVEWGPDGKPAPGLAEKWDVESNGQVYTFHLRKGLKWSDGAPFTAEDVVFAVNHVMLNATITPSFPRWLTAGGKPATVTAVDETTVRFAFTAPHALLLSYLCFAGQSLQLIRPKHYLSKFHPEFTPPAQLAAAAKEAGLASWDQLFTAKDDPWKNNERPVMSAWRTTKPTGGASNQAVLERNPFYWKVDPDGRQLPYVDRVTVDILDQQTTALRAANGEIDLQYRDIAFGDTPVLVKNAKSKGYQVYRWSPDAPWIGLHLNQSHPDPVMRRLMQDLNFRIALSVAIDREEMNEAIFAGEGWIGHPCGIKGDPYFDESFGKRHTEHDEGKANQLLDQLGLRRGGDGKRLRPDGKPLSLTILTFPYETGVDNVGGYEFVKRYWEKVGVTTNIQTMTSAIWGEKVRGNTHDIAGYTTAGFLWDIDPIWYVPTAKSTYWAPNFGAWYESGGTAGEAPPAPLRQLQVTYDELKITIDEAKRIELGKQILKAHDENIWMIGTVAMPFQPLVVDGDLRNVRKESVGSYRLGHEQATFFEQVFFTKPENH